MLWSRLFIPTLRESPSEAESASHRFLLRAGYIRALPAGSYAYLFLAQRSLQKIQRIIREEMESIGAQEILLPATQQEAALARGELRSYKQLPQIWYQIQRKLRDEPRPNAGLLRLRQYLEKESFSFDGTRPGLDTAYRHHQEAYRRIFTRCGLDFLTVEAGPAGLSHDFVVLSPAGDDWIARDEKSGYAATLATAASVPSPPLAPDPEGDFTPELFHTPGQKTIGDIARFTGLPETSQMKSLVMVAAGKPYLLLLRGDHQLSETKFQSAAGTADIRPATPKELEGWFGAAAGSLGPLGISNIPILADSALESRRNMIAGANKTDFHVRNVTPGKDFQPQWHDLRQAAPGERTLEGGEPLAILKSIRLGRTRAQSVATDLAVLDAGGQETPVFTGNYTISVERILCAAVELRHDDKGLILPSAIAPFTVVITPVNAADPALRQAAESLYAECRQAGLDALLDDRDERPGVKFKDADLIGIPYRITIGKKLPDGLVEISERHIGQSREIPLAEAVPFIRSQVNT